MKLGVNDSTNTNKKAAIHLMAGGPSKVNQPNSHPSNPVHKVAQRGTKPAAQTPTKESTPTEEPTPMAASGSESHDVNKMAVVMDAVAVAGLLFLAFC